MKINIVEKETFYVCGYSVETTLANNDKDVSALYSDFFRSGKDLILRRLKGSKNGYYGLSWYTKNHDRYCYLLGIEVGPENHAPENTELKVIPTTAYAVACFPEEDDIIKAWTEFYYNVIPENGYKVNDEHNFYFEYYPDNVHGKYELWVPVIKQQSNNQRN